MGEPKIDEQVIERMKLLTEQIHLTYQQVVILCREIDRINKIIGYENVLPFSKKELK